MLWLALGFAVVAVGSGGAGYVLKHNAWATKDTTDPLFVGGLVGLSLFAGMIFSAALSLPPVWRTRRAFADFRRGDDVVMWQYDPQFWAAYTEIDTSKLRKAAWTIFGFVGAISLMLAMLFIWITPKSLATRIEGSAIAIAVMGGVAAVYAWCVRAMIAARRRRMLASNIAYIGHDAVYCGGRFDFWGSQLHGLSRVNFEPAKAPGAHGMLYFVIALSSGGRKVAAGVDVLMLSTMSGAQLSNYSDLIAVPVPPGEDARASDIVDRLMQPRAVTATASAAASVPTDRPVHPAPPPPDAAEWHRRAKRRLRLAVLLLVISVILFFLIPVLDTLPPGSNEASAGASIDFVLCILTLLGACFSPFAAYAAHRKAHHAAAQAAAL